MSDRPGRLEGKVAIVTGAGSSGPGVGNGKAASVLFAREGAKVLLVDINADHAQETLELITAEGGEASVFQADVTNADHCRSMVESAVERYGRLDILDNNVGVILRAKFADIDPEDWDRVMAINLKSMMLASQAAVPPHDRIRRRLHHQHDFGGRHTGMERRRVCRFESGHHRSYADGGRRVRPLRDPGQCDRSGCRLYADGCLAAQR